jgi:hypothetical protein
MSASMRRAVLALAAAACLAALPACGGTTAPPPRPTALEPRWEDAFDATPEIVAIVFPTALRRDAVYGTLVRRVIELVRDRSPVVAQTRALDAMEDAEEVIVAARPSASDPIAGDRGGEVVIVVRGVRADVDPAALVDAEGRALWSPGPPGPVRELVHVEPAAPADAPPAEPVAPASLFELPGRTWVIASGPARARARSSFARPLGRPAWPFEPHDGRALALLRINGPSLVARVHALRPSGGLHAVGSQLNAFTVELPGGPAAAGDGGPERDVRATLAYANEDAAAFSEVTLHDALGAIARKKPEELAWLGGATVDRSNGKAVVVTAQVPPRLVAFLLHANAAPLELPPAGP